MVKQKFSGGYQSLILISKFIETEGEKAGLNEDDLYAVKLAVDEACTNIIEHAYEEKGEGDIICECIDLSDGFKVVLNDKGKKFDPDSIAAPNIGGALKDLKSRGAGLFLIKKLIDEVKFEFDDELGTTLSLKKDKR
jgi:serine/threonine-protein kinase RsbW